MAEPLISICIPAYKRVEFLKRLLDSIAIQQFRDFEVVISDDSPANEVKELIALYSTLPIIYKKNPIALGTPANWNHAIRSASGKWIKLMHDDDWFCSPESLKEFAKAATETETSLIFSAYSNYYFNNGKVEPVFLKAAALRRINRDPVSLISGNVVGPPSVVLHKNDGFAFYDEQLKWLVDIDFYCSRTQREKFRFINKVLVNVGIGEEQVTQSCFRIPDVELPEHFILLQKTGTSHLKSIRIYDAWWRLFRNLGVYTREQLISYVKEEWPPVIYRIMEDAGRSKYLTSFGPFSKALMTLSYLKNRSMLS